MSSPPSKAKLKNPWSPTQIGWVSVLFGALPATALWALNNRRLRIAQPRSTFVFVFAGLAIYLLIQVRMPLVEDWSPRQGYLPLVALAMNIIVSWQLFSSQRAAFARHHHSGGRTAIFWSPVWVGALCGLLVIGVNSEIKDAQTQRDYQEFERVAASLEEGPVSPKAESFFKEFKLKHPEDARTYWNLTVIYDQTNRAQQAKNELRELIQLDPDDDEARTYLRQLEEE